MLHATSSKTSLYRGQSGDNTHNSLQEHYLHLNKNTQNPSYYLLTSKNVTSESES